MDQLKFAMMKMVSKNLKNGMKMVNYIDSVHQHQSGIKTEKSQMKNGLKMIWRLGSVDLLKLDIAATELKNMKHGTKIMNLSMHASGKNKNETSYLFFIILKTLKCIENLYIVQ